MTTVIHSKYSPFLYPHSVEVVSTDSPVVLPVRDAELHVAALAEVPLQPNGLPRYLVENPEHQLFGCHWRREDADVLLVGVSGVSPCSD